MSSQDLIDDRAVSSLDDDQFRHEDFVAELAGLAREVPTPANVALYAPWGSGKTGLAHLLAAEFKEDDAIRFARFDALKYAETPMRRQFLSQLARALKMEDPKYTKGLYRAETTNNFSLPVKGVGWFAAAFVAVLGIALGAVALAGLIYGFAGPHQYWHDFRAEWAWGAPKAFVPATLLSVVGALAGKRFTVERRTDIPSSEEQFEDTFVDLVKEAVGMGMPKRVNDEKKRLVVFVDELDRCSPPAVASVLETLRTFLEVRGCVFIVAADQQALEAALSLKVKQATPSNSVSPYYSAGSAYLDKVFQYQLSLPALKPQRLTTYALGLVKERGGLWARVRDGADLDEVISVLVPTHVTSPRRVKALLNNFALLYRLAERRVEEQVLAGEVVERANELAKLGCLRLEFPLFAADLVLDPRMPQLVSELADEPNKPLPPTVTPEVAERAREWAKRERAVAEYLAPSRTQAGAADRTSESAGASEEEDKAAEVEEVEAGDEAVIDTTDESDADGSSDDAPHLSGEARDAVQREHSAQLLRYLKRTRAVPGPGRDLVYLESAGASLGVSFDGADELERAAVDGDAVGVLSVIEALDDADQLAAFRVLAHTVRHTAVGLEARMWSRRS